MISGKNKAYIILSKLGYSQEKVLALLPTEINSFFNSYQKDNIELSHSEELSVLEEALSILSSEEPVNTEPEAVLQSQDVLLSNPSEEILTSEAVAEDHLDKDHNEEEDVQEESHLDQYNAPEKIARKLSQQKQQIISFFMTNMEDEMLKQAVMYHLDRDIVDNIDQTTVEMTPISKKVYERLYYELCIKKEADNEDNEEDSMPAESINNPENKPENNTVEDNNKEVEMAGARSNDIFSSGNATSSFGGLFS